MGKKPVLGLVGLAWLGLTVGGCKSGCDCDKSVQKPPQRRADNGYAKAWRQPKPQNAVEQQPAPQEGSVAAKGADPRSQPAYNYDVSTREAPREQESVAEQIQRQPGTLPHELTPESTAALKKQATAPELLQTGRTETPGTPQGFPDAQGPAMGRPEGAVPPTPGAGMGDVLPHHQAGLPGGEPVPPAPPSVEKVGNVPPPPPQVGAPGAPTDAVKVYEPASMPTPSPLSTAPKAPPVEAGGMVAPAGGVTPPALTSPVYDVPPPAQALQKGVRESSMPPLPAAPESTPPLPSVPTPTPVDPGQ